MTQAPEMEKAMDILERLRGWQDYEPVKMFGGEILKDVTEAAAEIKRLRGIQSLSLSDATLTGALAGLPDRLDRLYVADQQGERFILSTDSARNIVEITREWLRNRLPAAPLVAEKQTEAK